MSTFLTLGNVTFTNDEVPESINFGGKQLLSKMVYPGGKRDVFPMGRDDNNIRWKGWFRGSTATFRARYLDYLRIKGDKLNLQWSQFNYSVVIQDYNPDFNAIYDIPYSISVCVVQDLNNPFKVLLPVGYDSAIENLMIEANDLASAIANPSISSALAILSETLNGIASLANATSSIIASVTGPLNSCFSAVSSGISSVSSELFG